MHTPQWEVWGHLEFLRVKSAVVGSLKRFGRVVYEEFDDAPGQAALAALRACLLVGQPLGETGREREGECGPFSPREKRYRALPRVVESVTAWQKE